MSEKEPPIPPPGRIFVAFKPPGSKKFSAHIVLPNGHKEVFQTDSTDLHSANGITNGRVRELYKEHNMESPTEYKRRTGSRLSVSAIRVALAQGKVPDESAARDGKGRAIEAAMEEEAAEEETVSASNGEAWGTNIVRIENKLAMGYQRIMGLFLLGMDNNPAEFREHVRAIVTEVTLSGLTPTGRFTKKRGRPPGS